jgi:hypothetical protein
MSCLDGFVDELAQRVAAIVVARLREGEPGMIDQNASPLGTRRHCAATTRRMARGQPGAAKVGRRYLLSQEALGDELARMSRRSDDAATAIDGDPVEKLKRKLALVRKEEP